MKAKHCTLGHVLGVLLVLCGSLFLSCTNENDLSGDQNDGTDPGRIATLEEQAASIEASIRDLEEVYEKHEELIEKLSTEVSGLEDLLDALESSGAYEDPTETQAYKELKERYSSLQNAKSLLSEKIDSLEAGISKLQEYVDDELESSEDWIGSTFATLEQYNEVQGVISSIRSLVEQYKTEVTSGYTKAIEEAIAEAEESMKEWVNETLAEGYYTKAEIDGKITVLQTQVTEGDAALQKLAAALTQAENDLRAAYKKAIEDAITDNNGKISGEIAAAVKTAQDNLQAQIDAINSDIEKIKDRLDIIEADINSINEQITAINGSIDTLKVVDAELKGYIESLQTTAADLQSKISATNTEIENVKKEMGDEIDAVEQSLLNELDSLKVELENGLAGINEYIDTLEAKDAELEGRIGDLNKYVEEELATAATEDWANATFATLDQYEKMQETISDINSLVGDPQGSITELEERLNKNIDTDIKAAIDALRTELGADYAAKIEAATDAVTSAYTAAIATAKGDIEAAYTKAIEEAIAEAEESMKEWVNKTLAEGYYTKEEIDGKITALQTQVTEGDDALQEEIDDLAADLAQAENDLRKAIDDAITENNGKISEDIASSITEVYTEIDLRLKEIQTKLESRLSDVEQRVDEILAMIQSVTYMPEYSDGAAYVGIFSRTLEMSFKLSPSSVVASLKEVWESSLSVKFLTTKSTKAAPVMKDLSIKSAEFDETIGTVTVTVDCSNLAQSFYTGETSASASLFIYDGHNNVSSDFVPLVLNEDETIDLPSLEAANCYIVSESGWYQFRSAKGNSLELLSDVESAEVLWESFGTDVTPEVGDLVSAALYRDGNIYFKTADTFKEGNAVIAAKDASGKILWSWHIWLTDQPEEQVYYNNAGTMMDRNLGATSATPGDVGALGLLYQWGRKDPFLGSSSISSDIEAKSTGTWPSAVSSNSTNGTIEYATAYPTTFIKHNSNNYDWYYTGSSSTDNTRWTTSATTKSIYDPCPSGWRVPDGGDNGIWSKAGFDDKTYDSTNEGMSFSISSPSTTWYPASGYRGYGDGGLSVVGNDGNYWSASANSYNAYCLYFYYLGYVGPSGSSGRAGGLSVRCIKEGTGGGSSDSGDSSISTSSAVSLTTTGTSNSYIVSQKGTYSFPTVKGNSSASVGSVESAEVLWESFGTDVTPEVGDLVSAALYRDGNIYFKTADTFKEGNAVIAAKDASGKILWSWHIWLTDQPKEHVYKNNAGTMMDRNLGATSATPGDVGALGLLYQWGRKDPFLGSSSISSITLAKSTITWPSAVVSSSATGTVDYAILNPTTFVTGSPSCLYDWHYASRDNTLWTTSDKTKSIYDPCPAGWRVPDGGSNGVWSKAGFDDKTYDSTNEGMSFSISSPSTTWYPASGCRDCGGGGLLDVGDYGRYWSASPSSYFAYGLYFADSGYVHPLNGSNRASGNSVRCIKEGTGGGSSDSGDSSISTSSAVSLTTTGTSNSYIVSQKGTYSFPTVKGNSSASVGSVESAEVLWESFGTDVTPEDGDLVSAALYRDGNIYFKTADTFKEGNAVIAAKDASGKILWSWHIWLTDQPEEQVYYNNAGTMMDRNLGATSATPGDVGALGLLYQWGRKDPFLGSSSISSNIEAKSTIVWPSVVSTSFSVGTVDYVTSHPTTYVLAPDSPHDWHYSSRDNSLWTTSEVAKSIYDPCPSGWRVPDGGNNGIWSKAGFDDKTYDSTNEGMSFSISSPSTTWYPASGYRGYGDGGLSAVGDDGNYWSASPISYNAYLLNFSNFGNVYPSNFATRVHGRSVRCIKEGTGGGSSDSGDSNDNNVKEKREFDLGAQEVKWSYTPDAAQDAGKYLGIPYSYDRTLQVTTDEIKMQGALLGEGYEDVVTTGTLLSTTVNGVASTAVTFGYDAVSGKATVTYTGFEWDKTYDIVANYETSATDVEIKFTLTTVDRKREPIIVKTNPTVSTPVKPLVYKKDMAIAQGTYNVPFGDKLFEELETAGNIAGIDKAAYLTDVFNSGKAYYDILNSWYDNDLWGGGRFLKDDGGADTWNTRLVIDGATCQFTFGYSYKSFPEVITNLKYVREFTTWYGQEFVLEHVLTIDLPKYDFAHTSYYVKANDDNTGWYSIIGQYFPSITATNVSAFEPNLDMNKVFNVVDRATATPTIIPAAELATYGLVTEFELESTIPGISIRNNEISYLSSEDQIGVTGKLYIVNTDGSRLYLPTSFDDTYANYVVKKCDPIGKLTVTGTPVVEVSEAKIYTVNVMDYLELKDNRNGVPTCDLIVDGAFLNGDGTNGYSGPVTSIYGLEYRCIIEAFPSEFFSIISFNDRGVLTFDNRNQLLLVEDVEIPIRFRLSSLWCDYLVTVNVVFVKNVE